MSLRRILTALAATGLAVWSLAACDAGPSAVMHDGDGKAASQPVAPAQAPVWADKSAPDAKSGSKSGTKSDTKSGARDDAFAGPAEASMSLVEPPASDHSAAAHYGATLKIPSGDRAVITDTRYGDWPLWSANRKYSASDNAHYHFEKHGPEFGAKSYGDYMAMVHGFIHSPPQGTLTLKRNNGDTLFYDPRGNVFAVMTKAGAPRTLFRPDDGAAYWDRQKQIEAGRRTIRRDNQDGE